MFQRKKLEEFTDELDMEGAPLALTSSCLFEFRALFWSTSVIMFLSLLSNTNKC